MIGAASATYWRSAATKIVTSTTTATSDAVRPDVSLPSRRARAWRPRGRTAASPCRARRTPSRARAGRPPCCSCDSRWRRAARAWRARACRRRSTSRTRSRAAPVRASHSSGAARRDPAGSAVSADRRITIGTLNAFAAASDARRTAGRDAPRSRTAPARSRARRSRASSPAIASSARELAGARERHEL